MPGLGPVGGVVGVLDGFVDLPAAGDRVVLLGLGADPDAVRITAAKAGTRASRAPAGGCLAGGGHEGAHGLAQLPGFWCRKGRSHSPCRPGRR